MAKFNLSALVHLGYGSWVILPMRTLLPAVAMTLCALTSPIYSSQDRSQGRSMVISKNGIVASEHPLASQAGAMVLAKGGSAVDAAVAANAAMSVLAPMMCGMGGDLFAIVYEAKTDRLYGLNASGWAPAGMTPDFLGGQGITKMPISGIHSITVPGAVAGWQKLIERFGRTGFSVDLSAAIRYAEEGFPVTEWVADYWADGATLLRNDPEATRTFLPNGTSPKVGELFRNPDLAWSLRQIVASGGHSFYQGELAERLLKHARANGGTLAGEDLKAFEAEWVDPISTTYRGWTVYEIPPNGQGIAALEMLNLMESFPLRDQGHNSVRALHTMIESKKLAYADMLQFVADQRFSKVPVDQLLSKAYAHGRAALIDPVRAISGPTPGNPVEPGPDTTYLCAVDREGNMVSLIQSTYYAFGSGLVAEGTGFALQNRGGLFSLDPGHPNHLAGRKRPLHTIIPGFMSKGDTRIAFGIMGGWNQSQAHAQFVSNLVDHDLNIQAAMEAPRFSKHTFEGNDLMMESRVPADVRSGLEALGHEINLRGDYTGSVGGGQAVLRDYAAGINYGASDPRKDGAAIPEP